MLACVYLSASAVMRAKSILITRQSEYSALDKYKAFPTYYTLYSTLAHYYIIKRASLLYLHRASSSGCAAFYK